MTVLQAAPFKPEGPHPLVGDIAPGEPYPVQALGPLQTVVEAVQGMTQAPVAIPAQSALSVASLAVQGFADVETLGGVRPVSLFTLTIAKSGERKSACDAPFMSALREHEREQVTVLLKEMEKWQNEHAVWEASHRKIVAELSSAKANGKQASASADLDALGPEPQAPLSADRIVTEPTFEGLTKLFASAQPSLGLFSDEGGQFLGGHAMNRENRQKTLAAFNDLWQPKIANKLSPVLHQNDPLIPVSGAIVGPTHDVLVLVCQRRFDHVRVIVPRIQDRAGSRPEAMCGHLILGVAHPAQCRIERVLG